jgi:curved DNA-binding protein CbpA
VPATRDPYDLLDLDRSADVRQIRAAYRRLAKRYHPDASRDDGRMFVALRNAYETLTDASRREEWDRRHPGSGRARRPAVDPARPTRRATPRDDGRTAADARDEARSTRRDPTRRAAQPRDRRGRFMRADAAPPWWEEIRGGRSVGAELPGSRGDPHLGPSSSGAAWSSAARAYFRRLTRQESGSRSSGPEPRADERRARESQLGRAR